MNEWQIIESLNANADCYSDAIGLRAGDDCALWNTPAGCSNVVSTDTLVAGVHFPEHLAPEAIAYRALMVNLSDLAAMGAQPLGYLNAISLPSGDECLVTGLSAGLRAAEQSYRLSLLGGNICRAAQLSLTISVIGLVPEGQELRRDRAQADDDLYLSGELGAAALGLQLYQGSALANAGGEARHSYYLDRYLRPRPRIALGQALRGRASACIDISDGLLADLGHLLQASALAAELDLSSVPIARSQPGEAWAQAQTQALTHGDDYELLFSAAVEQRSELAALARALQIPLTRIGKLRSGVVGAISFIGQFGWQPGWQPDSVGYRHF